MKRNVIAVMMGLVMAGSMFGNCGAVQADDAGDNGIQWRGYTVAAYDEQGRMIYHPIGDANKDGHALEYLLANDDPKTLVIAQGDTVTVDQVVDIGSNTTIIADGATIQQEQNGKGVLKHIVDGGNYDAIENIKIQGGRWENTINSEGCTMVRFAHGKNLVFEDMDIQTNYAGHGLELIACRDVKVKNCKIIAENEATRGEDIREEALQIDIATPLTAPGVLSETANAAYVDGQISQNITVSNCTVKSSRGICVSFPGKERSSSYINNFHTNITIQGCHVTGVNAEAISMFNAVGCVVKNNVAVTESNNKAEPYSDGIHLILMGKNKISTKYQNKVLNNKAYGNYYGIEVTSKKKCQYGRTVVKGNKIYSKQGKARCLSVKYCTKSVTRGNKLHKW